MNIHKLFKYHFKDFIFKSSNHIFYFCFMKKVKYFHNKAMRINSYCTVYHYLQNSHSVQDINQNDSHKKEAKRC